MDRPKVAFCATLHYSSLRKKGIFYLNKFLDSLNASINFPVNVYLLDNESEVKLFDTIENKHPKLKIKYRYIADQKANNFITGAWNTLAKNAFEEGNDLLIGFADDLEYDSTINGAINFIWNHPDKDNTIFAPVTPGIRNGTIWARTQKRKKVDLGYLQETNFIHGSVMAFTKNFYNQVKLENGDLFYIYKHHGSLKLCSVSRSQERMLQIYWKDNYETKGLIYGDWFVNHFKDGSWKSL